MAYDPQASRRRPRPDEDAPAPIDAILGRPEDRVTPTTVADDPPPTPAVTPERADPPSDTFLLNTGLAAAIGGLVALLTLRHLRKRRHRRRAAASHD